MTNQKIITCAFCQGTGVHPHFRGTCPVCKGKGKNQVAGKYMVCDDCRSSGQKRGTTLTCYSCAGTGVLPDTREDFKKARKEIKKARDEIEKETKEPSQDRKQTTSQKGNPQAGRKIPCFCQSCAREVEKKSTIKVCLNCFRKIKYAILRNNLNDKVVPLVRVDFRGLTALVKDAEHKDYSNLPKQKVIKELSNHQKTIERLMENCKTILPVKFGTILKDEEVVRTVLEKGYFFLRDMLRKMEDKIELDLVCFWNEEKAAQMAFQESKRVKNFYKKIASQAKTPRMVARQRPRLLRGEESLEGKIALGKLVADYLSKKKEKISKQILRVLKKEAVGSVSHVLVDVNMLLNEAFLVKRENEERFNHALNLLDSKFSDLINFRLVGPLPPYSFATVVVEAQDKEEVEKAKELLKFNGELDKESLKKAYDRLAFKLHPDHGGNPLEFELVTQSYKLLRKYAQQGLVAVHLYKWFKEQP